MNQQPPTGPHDPGPGQPGPSGQPGQPGPSGWGAPGPSPYGPSPYGAGSPSQSETVTGGSGTRGKGRRRGLLIGVGAGLLVGGVGAAVWGATAWFATGAQPAEALPADTLGYVAIDLDPSGGQKLAALRTLEKFPIVTDNTDLGSDEDTDLKEALFDLVQGSGDVCPDLDYGDDLAGWLGDRAAFAAVPGDEEPTPVVVVGVTDEAAAEDGLAAVADCAGGQMGYVVEGDWAVVAETEDLAQGVVDGAGEGDLAEDGDFQRWTEAAGGAGVVTGYAGPGLVEELAGPEELGASLEGFEGAAMSLRFADEGVELQSAGYNGLSGADGLLGSDGAEAVADGVPADTAALAALALEPGWSEGLLEQISAFTDVPTDELATGLESEVGVSPDDLETLLGDGAAVAVSTDLDLEGLADGSTPPTEAPIGARVTTDDPEASEEVLDRLRGQLPPEGRDLLASEASGDVLVVGPDGDYRQALAGDGGLAGDEKFRDAVPEASRSSALVYLDLDALDAFTGLLDAATGDDSVSENLEPLSALGVSTWLEDDVPHSLVRITTD